MKLDLNTIIVEKRYIHRPLDCERFKSSIGACVLAAAMWAMPAYSADSAAGLQAYRKKDYATAFREWKAAAEKGQAKAQFNLGMLYLKGQGVGKDPQLAFRWLRSAADQGNAEAQFQVGQIREKGVGMAPNYADAKHWYELSAKRDVRRRFRGGVEYGARSPLVQPGGGKRNA